MAKIVRAFAAAYLMLTLLCTACLAEAVEDNDTLIRDMILDYGYYPDEAAPYVKQKLEAVAASDPALAETWTTIMQKWDYARRKMPINMNRLPDGLDRTDALCIVVLGYELNPDGSPKDELIDRLKVALDAAERYPNATILCTGGATASRNRDATEGGQMAAWLRKKGVAEARIIVEEKSVNTGQNAMYSHALIREKCPNVTQIAIISGDYHIPWATILFETEFILHGEDRPITVVSNAASKTKRHADSFMKYQTAGVLEIAGYTDVSHYIYTKAEDRKPKLH